MGNPEQSSKARSVRTVTALGVALLVVAVAVAAYLFGLGFFQTAEPTPTSVAVAPTLPPTAVPPTDTPAPTSTATRTPTPTPTSTPTPSPTPELGTSNVYVEYILDASGSMNEKLPGGGIKLAVAKDLLTENLQAFLPETNVGLRAYGHRVYYQQTAKSCQDIELIAPVEKGQIESIATWLQDFKAQGMTPLAESIRQAMDDFIFDPAHINSIVLLSDGIETCGGDPCGLVEELKAQGVNFTIHVIGLDVDTATREQLECIARAGGGTYHDANSEQDLDEALGAVQEDVTEGEVIVAYGVDTPTPVPPTPTLTPEPPTPTPTNTPLPPTLTPKATASGRIVFASSRDGNLEIYVMNSDGTGQTRLTNNSASDFSPRWSPDGARIAFTSGRNDARPASCFQWCDTEVYVMKADGSGQTNLTNNPAGDWAPSWSPDGKRIAFASTRSGNNREEIYIMAANGSGAATLTPECGFPTWCENPDWSPDGGRFAVEISPTDTPRRVVVVNADGSGFTRLAPPSASLPAGQPAWSPDGTRIAFVAWQAAKSGQALPGDIYVMNADGSGQINLTNNPADDLAPTWSPDGKRIAFASNRDGQFQIYVMNADGSGGTRLTTAGGTSPDWSPR